MQDEFAELLLSIERAAALPLDQARALPAAAYRDAALHVRERERIFEKAWHCIGHASELRDAGDRIGGEIAGEPVFVVRDEFGKLRAFSNVCRHRNARLVAQCGRGRRIVCPYHGWSYDLSGQLLAAPYIELSALEGRDRALPELACQEWMGWVYVSLAADPPDLSSGLGGLDTLFAPYAPETMTLLWRHPFALDVNWKSVAENFMESYHVSVVHPETVHRGTPTSGVRCWPGGPGYAYHTLAVRPRGQNQAGETEVLACVFPMQLVSVTPGVALWVTLDPIGPDRTEATIAMAVSDAYVAGQGGDRKAVARDSWAYVDRLNGEDKAILGEVHAGLSARHAVSGRLSPLERPIWEFIRYLSAQLVP